MYLSKIILRSQDPRLIAAVMGNDAYRSHQTCWKLFPETERRNFLYRRNSDGFITLSHRVPKDSDELWNVEVKPFSPKLVQGDLLNFMVTANATVCKNGKRHDVIMNAKSAGEDTDEAARDWLVRCGTRSGFTANHIRIGAYRQHVVRKPGHLIKYSTIDYDGVIRVEDPDRVINTLTTGIGRAKGFGCGLLLVRRSAG